MGDKQKWNPNPIGPTDKSKRTFHDSFNEDTRYSKKEKRRRRLEKEKLNRVKNFDLDDLED